MAKECDRLVIITDNLLTKTTNTLKQATDESIESTKRRKIEYVYIETFSKIVSILEIFNETLFLLYKFNK